MTNKPIVKISGHDRWTFLYQVLRTSIIFAVVKDEAHLAAGYEWERIGKEGVWLIYVSNK